MTKLWVMSDLHFEFHVDGGAYFLKSLPDLEHDAAIVAGDLCSFHGIAKSLRLLSKRFRRVIYCLGNHEAYGASISESLDVACKTAERLDNLEVLECESTIVGSTRIHGASLWFPYSGYTQAESGMTDFWQIRGLRDDVDARNKAAVRYLEANVKQDDVVMTHHLPHVACVSEMYADSPLNAFFVGCAGHVVTENRPRAWISGHTHSSFDFQLESTRMVCNPLGYVPSDTNPSFYFGKIVEVP